ncbi:MAG TPA: polyphosphate:AMP phosphotransferase [Gammaproteobacteria bacterium]
MFEVATLGHKIGKKEYEASVPDLRTQLLLAQEALKEANFPVIVLVTGVDGSGKGDVINLLNSWLDPRYVRTHAFGVHGEEERERPHFWRYWMSLPPKGRIGIFVGSWYSDPIAHRVIDVTNDTQLEQQLSDINAFEETLVQDGALIIKFWLHLSKSAQKKRMKELEANEATRWRVTKLDKKHLKRYDNCVLVAEATLRETSTGSAPWIIVEATDERYRNLTVGNHLLERIRYHLDTLPEHGKHKPHLHPIAAPELGNHVSILGKLDLTKALTKQNYEKQLAKSQGRLAELARLTHQQKRSSIVLLEGWDAAGKGGLIRRIIPAMDARQYRIIPIAAPTDEERAQHYLWRFWRHIPRAGKVTIYDRSWYGRVLVERVEGFAHENEWMRAYTEINNFEEQLCENGIVLVKLWLHISKEEQLARFKERELTPFKQYKITEEDYRNRDKWDAYENAVNDMVERTSTANAKWHLVEGNDKYHARIKALKIYCERLEKALERK